MQPIFKEMIQMWNDLGVVFPKQEDKTLVEIKEGSFWYENGIVKGFCKETNDLINLYKINISDNLEITSKIHKDYLMKKNRNKKFKTWEETIEYFNLILEEKERESLSLIEKYVSENKEKQVIVPNSTGKDSQLTSYLTNKLNLKHREIFNCTTLDVKESNIMARELGLEFVFPDKKYNGFYNWIKDNNLIPSRHNRSCCGFFKEQPTIDYFDSKDELLFLFGMRNQESEHRSDYGDEWCNTKWGKSREWLGILPIRKWSELEVWLYTLRENIMINPKYKMGYARVGCGIACPNYSKSTWILDKYWYETMFKRWRNILKDDFIKNNKWLIMNCTIKEYTSICWAGGSYRGEPIKEVIEEYAEYNNLEYDIAKKYFNKTCANGCLNKKKTAKIKIKSKEVLGMNMKLHGRQVEKFLCKNCLMRQYNMTEEIWKSKVEDFKNSGCDLF